MRRPPIVAVLLPQLTLLSAFRIPFELDTELPTVTCRKCVQFWASDPSEQNPLSCGPNSETCSGNACFMRQCKRCGLYQYISGCVRLTDWQVRDLKISRQRVELLNTRAGAAMLCEDNANHTTCICNQRDRCNDIHARIPFSTYSGSLFRGIVNIEAAIADFDPIVPRPQQPRHMFAMHWYPSSDAPRSAQTTAPALLLPLALPLLLLLLATPFYGVRPLPLFPF